MTQVWELNLHLLIWVRIHVVHVSELLFTQVAVVVTCMLKKMKVSIY